VALAAVGWADGQLTRSRRRDFATAAEEGLDIESLQKLEEAVAKPVDVGVVDRMNMSKSDRLFVYAVASWIATLDGEASSGRKRPWLSSLGRSACPRPRASAPTRSCARSPLSTKGPTRFDVRALRQTLDERLDAARAARLGGYAKESD